MSGWDEEVQLSGSKTTIKNTEDVTTPVSQAQLLLEKHSQALGLDEILNNDVLMSPENDDNGGVKFNEVLTPDVVSATVPQTTLEILSPDTGTTDMMMREVSSPDARELISPQVQQSIKSNGNSSNRSDAVEGAVSTVLSLSLIHI